MKPLLEVSDLSYVSMSENILSLNHISFSIYSGEFVSIFCPTPLENPLFSLLKGNTISEYSSDTSIPLNLGHLLLKNDGFIWDTTFLSENAPILPDKMKFLNHHYQVNCDSWQHPISSRYCSKMQRLILTLSTIPDLLLLENITNTEDDNLDISFLDELYELQQTQSLSILLLTSSKEAAILLSNFIYMLNPKTGTITSSLLPFPYHLDLLPSQKKKTSDYFLYFNQLEKELQLC